VHGWSERCLAVIIQELCKRVRDGVREREPEREGACVVLRHHGTCSER